MVGGIAEGAVVCKDVRLGGEWARDWVKGSGSVGGEGDDESWSDADGRR